MDKVEIENVLAQGHSLRKSAKILGVTLSKLYYYVEKYEIKTRSKSEAQKQFLKEKKHQRKGKTHSTKSKEKISDGLSEFWDSSQGEVQKERIVKQRRSEWNKKTPKQKRAKLRQLKDAPRPGPGELSKFGLLLSEFLVEKDLDILVGEKLVLNHASDIVIKKHKIVIELIPPIYVFGREAEEELFKTYSKIGQELDKLGYKMLIIEQVSNGLSRARCTKVWTEIVKLINGDSKHISIQS
jgi:hypothetical protein